MRVFIVLLAVYGTAALDSKLSIVKISDVVNSTHTRIVGGTATDIERYPFAVQLQYLSRTVCGGSLITVRHVLTAAHCFYDEYGNMVSITTFTVRVGSAYLQSGGSVHGVSAVIPHEHYNTPLRDNDIAVMLLSSDVALSARVSSARVPAAGEQLPDHTPVWHVGWGLQYYGATSMSAVLNEAQVYTVAHGVCQERYQLLAALHQQPYPVTGSMLCSGLLDIGGRDACQGDSGGPLVFGGDVVVGVTAWGYRCAEPAFPGVNSKVSSHTAWINATVTRFNASPAVGSGSWVILTSLLSVISCSLLK